MAGAVQVLDLSDDEDNLGYIWSTSRPQAQSRSQPGIRPCPPKTPVTGDVVCLDSDGESEPIIVREIPSTSKLGAVLESSPMIEIFSIEDLMKRIPKVDAAPHVLEEPDKPSQVFEEIERRRKKQKQSDVASLANPFGDAEQQLKLREKELELERKQALKAEKKREKEEAKKKEQDEILKKKQEEKARKVAAKKAAQEKRKAEHEVARFSRKAALEHMVASVDVKVAENGSIGAQLLSRFVEKKLHFTLVSNPIHNSITWSTKRLRLKSQEIDQSEDTELVGSEGELTSSQVFHEDVHIQYILFIFEAEEFAAMIAESLLTSHVRRAQQHYPGFTICYLVNKMMLFLQKKDQAQYQSNDPTSAGRWQRPLVKKALAGLTTNFSGVHSRLCVDEADVADHVTGLMHSFADALYEPKLTQLSVRKNGEHVRSGDPFKEEIRKNLWLKALVAIPKVSGPCALAIGKIYPTMRSLFSVYLDNSKTDREKELLLKDILRESVLESAGGQRVGAVCSKQVYRVLMAQNGNLKVDRIDEDED